MCCPKKKFWTKQKTITPPFKLNGRSLRKWQWEDEEIVPLMSCILVCSFNTLLRYVVRLTRRVPLVEQELHTFPESLSSPPVFSEVQSLVVCVCFVDRYLSFCSFLLVIVLSVLLWFIDSSYPFEFGIFKLLLYSDLINYFNVTFFFSVVFQN